MSQNESTFVPNEIEPIKTNNPLPFQMVIDTSYPGKEDMCYATIRPPIINWQEKLKTDEVGKDGDTKFVYLKGLRRLAKERGIKTEKHTFGACFIWETAKKGAVPYTQIMYTVTFWDGETYSDVADAHFYNIGNDELAVYTTAIAASRAEARALRKALGIDLVSKEELSLEKAVAFEMTGAIKPEQKRLINTLKKKIGITSNQEMIREVIDREDVVSLDDVTAEEADNIIRWLNERMSKN